MSCSYFIRARVLGIALAREYHIFFIQREWNNFSHLFWQIIVIGSWITLPIFAIGSWIALPIFANGSWIRLPLFAIDSWITLPVWLVAELRANHCDWQLNLVVNLCDSLARLIGSERIVAIGWSISMVAGVGFCLFELSFDVGLLKVNTSFYYDNKPISIQYIVINQFNSRHLLCCVVLPSYPGS